MAERYSKNFLTNVIARVDFPNSLPVQENLPSELTKLILKSFPIFEPKKLVETNIKFTPEKKFELERELTRNEWHYYGKNREKLLVLTPMFLSMTYYRYQSFEKLRSEFFSVLNKMVALFGDDIQINRLGLRYINEINLDKPNPLDWGTYLDSNLLSMFSFAEDKSKIARAFNNLVFNYDDIILTFNYGMHNPDMPSTIRRKIFVLDYDAYNTDLQELDELEHNLTIFHEKIETLFERSIKDELRGIMNDL